jgi:hypothetical protein
MQIHLQGWYNQGNRKKIGRKMQVREIIIALSEMISTHFGFAR